MTQLSTTAIFTLAPVLIALPSYTVKSKLSDHIYPSAGIYVITPVEESVNCPCIGRVEAVK
jgi:hypothetical protein